MHGTRLRFAPVNVNANARPHHPLDPRALSFLAAGAAQGEGAGPRRLGLPLDLSRLVRLVCRRLRPAFERQTRRLSCEVRGKLPGRFGRESAERLLEALLMLASDLMPDLGLAVGAHREGGDAVIEARYQPVGAGGRTRRGGGVDLARLTRAREEWALRFWLSRGVARADGGRLSLLPGSFAPDGLCLTLPLDGPFSRAR